MRTQLCVSRVHRASSAIASIRPRVLFAQKARFLRRTAKRPVWSVVQVTTRRWTAFPSVHRVPPAQSRARTDRSHAIYACLAHSRICLPKRRGTPSLFFMWSRDLRFYGCACSKSCPIGFKPSSFPDRCDPCPSGTFGTSGATPCSTSFDLPHSPLHSNTAVPCLAACPLGQYNAAQGPSYCCVARSLSVLIYAPLAGLTVCTDCAVGTFAAFTGLMGLLPVALSLSHAVSFFASFA